MVGGAAIPGQSLGIVTLGPKSALVEVADLLLGSGEILVGRFAIPSEGLLVVTMDAAAGLEHSRQIVLRERIALVRGQTVVGGGALVIPWHADAIFIDAGELILCRSKALGSGFSVPSQELRVIECPEAGPKIKIPEGELRLGVPCSGGLANIRGGLLRKQQRRNQAEEKQREGRKTVYARGPGSLPKFS